MKTRCILGKDYDVDGSLLDREVPKVANPHVVFQLWVIHGQTPIPPKNLSTATAEQASEERFTQDLWCIPGGSKTVW